MTEPPGRGHDPRPRADEPRAPSGTRPAGDPARPVPWSVSDGIILIVWSIVAQVLVAIPFAAAGVELTGGGATVLLVIIVSQLVTLGGGIAWLAGKDALGRELLGSVPPAWRHAGIGLLAGISGWVLAAIVQAVLRIAFTIHEMPSQPFLEESVKALPTLALGAVSFLVLAPVVEELIYRGVLFQALRDRAGLVVGVVVSGAVFGAVHFELLYLESGGFNVGGVPAIVALSVLGAWFAFVMHKSGSLVTAVTAHATFNTISVALATLVA